VKGERKVNAGHFRNEGKGRSKGIEERPKRQKRGGRGRGKEGTRGNLSGTQHKARQLLETKKEK